LSIYGGSSNRGSIVTLIEAFGKKILICGDATVNTERFLLNTVKDRLQNLTVLQVGHHGSINTSSSQEFAEWVNPEIAVASAGELIPLHHLPSKAALDQYVQLMTDAGRTVTKPHETYSWEAEAMGSYIPAHPFYTQAVYTTGSYNSYELTYRAV
jgi:beta-lactamase superfamily II metal-dependent hydrolase